MDEIHELWTLAHPPEAQAATDYSRGIYQTIGYKEFEPYLSARAADGHVAPAPADALFAAGLESMKASTRQYAKRQVKWITGKLLPEVRKGKKGEVTVVLLDATGTSWARGVVYAVVRSSVRDADCSGSWLRRPGYVERECA